jgi:hypothetical protein
LSNTGSGFVPNNIQVFTSSGTWIQPAGATNVYVKLWGPGGTGSSTYNNKGGGGGGEYTEAPCAVSGNVTVTIGTPGSDTSFAGTVTLSAKTGANGTASGGAGGTGGTNTNGFSLPGLRGSSASGSTTAPGGLSGCPQYSAGYGNGGAAVGGTGVTGSSGLVIVYY